MFKKLLIIGAVIAIIPLEQERQAELYQVAKSTVVDISGFCIRNPDVCEKGNEAFDKLATKAEFGARLMVDIARERSTGTGSNPATRLLEAPPLQGNRQADRQQLALQPAATAPSPLPAQGEVRFPTYRDNQYNELYGSGENTLRRSDLQAGWRGNSLR